MLAKKCSFDFNASINTLLFWQISTPLTQQPHVINTLTDTLVQLFVFSELGFSCHPEPLNEPETNFPGGS